MGNISGCFVPQAIQPETITKLKAIAKSSRDLKILGIIGLLHGRLTNVTSDAPGAIAVSPPNRQRQFLPFHQEFSINP